MSLLDYFKKRDFDKTAEPKSGKKTRGDELSFVVQEHNASHLHYDFRLEMDGVLKSWAVPKGPSLDPQVKRLAMMVEDHPLDYRNFEGTIPKGQYGGGEVIVWDRGIYEPLDAGDNRKKQEKVLLEELEAGNLKFRLHGEKLKGEFALVKTPSMGRNAWLLIKHKDRYATEEDITLQDESVITGHRMMVEKSAPAGRRSTRRKKSGQTPDADDSVEHIGATDTAGDAPAAGMPKKLKPMLATLTDSPFDEEGWQYEVKWDGYRTLAYLNQHKVELVSRNLKSFGERFYPIAETLKTWKLNAVLDGEIVVLDKHGLSDFGALQNWRSEDDGELVYYVFDLLWYDGKNLMGLPLNKRQELLGRILPEDDSRIRLSKIFHTSGIDFFRSAEKAGLEGIMAKRSDSRYHPDSRSREWLKIKTHKRQEVVIGGFTQKENSPKLFSSLLLGVYKNGALQYAGKVGTGFTDHLQKEMMEQFRPLITSKNPFDNPPKEKATWLKPNLVCEVAYSEITRDGIFRQPSFKGMRIDKPAKEVATEIPVHTTELVSAEQEEQAKSPKAGKQGQDEGGRRGKLLTAGEDTVIKKINGHELKFTHLNKVFWPDEHITKGDTLEYYHHIAPYILPYLKDRPMSLNRFPNGIKAAGFFQKNVKDTAPDWASTFPYTFEGEHREYLVCTDEASLLWMVSLGCIEINPWFSRAQSPDHPDYCVIDLDPGKSTTFGQVIEAAQSIKDVLDAIDVPSYPKTSGSTGIHVYIPLGARYTYEQSQLFARLIAEAVNRQLPDFTTLERMLAKRKDNMYIDYLQNRPAATIAGPYSLRPKPNATVSAPLSWDEVKPGLQMKDFTIFNISERLRTKGDLFEGVLGKGIDMEKALQKAKRVF